MKTETTILNLNTSAKSEEKTGENTKVKCSTTTATKSKSQHIKQDFSCEHSACQNQPQFEHEIFQTIVRKQNSKESNSQNKLKTLCVENLNKNISEEDLYELFGLRNTTYLKENCCVKIVFSKSDLSRGFAFITARYHVCTELIKLNVIDFK